MKKEKIVVANLKMNMTTSEISEYLKIINKNVFSEYVVFCPTSIYIPYFLKQAYSVGIQNTYFKASGSYTGETSPKQARSMGVTYVIVGHSDRRTNFEETDSIINKKVIESLKNDLNVILCIGETEEERKLLKTDKIIKRQIVNALRDIDENSFDKIFIAYEPIWSIGTGNIPDSKEIEKMVSYIKNIVRSINAKIDIKVLYGGSIDEINVSVFNKIDTLSGYLVGTTALNPSKFIKVIEAVKN